MPGPWGTVKDRRFETEVPGAKRRCRITDEVTNVPYYNLDLFTYAEYVFYTSGRASTLIILYLYQDFMKIPLYLLMC